MIDATDTGGLEIARLLLGERAQRGAVADAVHFFHGPDRFHDFRPFTFGGAAAAVDDAKSASAARAGIGAGLGHFGAVHHRMGRYARVIMGALSAELAILAAIAELGRQDAAKGHAIAVKMTADLVSSVKQIVQRLAFQSEKLASFLAGQLAAVDDA